MTKKLDNSANYGSFLTRDYKSVVTPPMRTRPSITRLHIVLLLAVMLVIASLLSFFSLEADAIRHVEPNPISITEPALPTEPTAELDPLPATVLDSPLEWVSVSVKSGDSMARIFNQLNLPAETLHRLMQEQTASKHLRHLQPGQTVKVQFDDQNAVHALVLELSRFNSLAIQRVGDNFITSQLNRDTEKRTGHAVAKIDSSLFEAGQRAGMSDGLIMEMAGIFGWDIDFALDIRTGDHFALIYEEHYLDGERFEQGPILAAEFTTQGQTYRAIRFTDSDGNSDYYTPEGQSMRKAFLRTPVDFRRISSRFGSRKHPVLNTMKMHKGVDYAAPTGTPIRSSGDGKVIYKGSKGNYGRTIIIQHGGSYSTLYAHMSKFKRGVEVGRRVRQGEIIGYVGSSGLATGPHLHYEFRVNGVHRNPLTIKLPNADPLPGKYQLAFAQHTQEMLLQLKNVKQVTDVAVNQP